MKTPLLIATLLCAVLCSYAQEEVMATMPIDEYSRQQERLAALTDSVGNLARQVVSLTDSLQQQQRRIHTLEDSLADARIAHTRLDLLADSLQALRQQLAAVDILRVRYANQCLYLPYDAKRVERGLTVYEGIEDPAIKKQYVQVQRSLQQYAAVNRELLELLTRLQRDPRRDTPFGYDQWKAGALRDLDNTAFARECKDRKYTIAWLEEIYTESRRRLVASDDSHFADLNDLILKFPKK